MLVAHALAQVRRALALPGVPQSGRLLELGCGDGCITVRLARELPFAVSGVDIVPLAVALAAQREGVELELRQGSVLALPWPDGHFDAVVDGNLLHCIVLGDRARCLAEAWRVLAPGGALIVMCLAGDPPPSAVFAFDPVTRCQIRDGVAGRHFATQESLLAELTAAGFEIAAHWLNPATHAEECDEMVVAARWASITQRDPSPLRPSSWNPCSPRISVTLSIGLSLVVFSPIPS